MGRLKKLTSRCLFEQNNFGSASAGLRRWTRLAAKYKGKGEMNLKGKKKERFEGKKKRKGSPPGLSLQGGERSVSPAGKPPPEENVT